ncbi:MAG TPA: hypothetical protein VJY35_09185 [Candidatus Eisenbacteria bacterium]|nr:hypothetical protein [Candidatus Eisenbacteria bacterium]
MAAKKGARTARKPVARAKAVRKSSVRAQRKAPKSIDVIPGNPIAIRID